MIKICDMCKDLYSKTSYNSTKRLKHQFSGYKKIEKNYSQMYQDIFVLSMLDGKKNGTYLEIGSGNPETGNNSYLLENVFSWTGVSIDKAVNSSMYRKRVNTYIMDDALSVDYQEIISKYISSMGIVDYLQIDCDPPKQSYEILKKIPFDLYKFAVITFEHDYYCDKEKKYRALSRDFLNSVGYEMVAGNVGVNSFFPFEDWWVHPDLVDRDIINKFKSKTSKNIDVQEYMLDSFVAVNEYKCEHE